MSGNGAIAQDVLAARVEGPPLLLVEVPAEGGGLELLIYDEAGTLIDVSFVPAALAEEPVGDVS
ncbi:hypothetical protein ACIQWL_08930 [Streptomyces mirabilis]|uniref:hypothetical protein n=1 Tax=Streptomyces mirabilis TaxID=68239 RepID=UPI003829BC78